MKDYAIISKHENGFWVTDVYWKRETPPAEGDVPNHLKTFKVGEPIESALQWAKTWYMHAEVLFKCASCKLTYRNGDPCPAIRGGCPMGGDF